MSKEEDVQITSSNSSRSNNSRESNNNLLPLQSESNVSYSSNSFRGDGDSGSSISISMTSSPSDNRDVGTNISNDNDKEIFDDDKHDDSNDHDNDHDHYFDRESNELDNSNSMPIIDDAKATSVTANREHTIKGSLSQEGVEVQLEEEGNGIEHEHEHEEDHQERRLDDGLSYSTKHSSSNLFDDVNTGANVDADADADVDVDADLNADLNASIKESFTPQRVNTFDGSEFSMSPTKSPEKKSFHLDNIDDDNDYDNDFDEESHDSKSSDDNHDVHDEDKNRNYNQCGSDEGKIHETPLHGGTMNLNTSINTNRSSSVSSKIDTQKITRASQLLHLFDEPQKGSQSQPLSQSQHQYQLQPLALPQPPERQSTVRTVNFVRQNTEQTNNFAKSGRGSSSIINSVEFRNGTSTLENIFAQEKSRETDPLLQYKNLMDSYTDKADDEHCGQDSSNSDNQFDMKKEIKIKKFGNSMTMMMPLSLFTSYNAKSIINGTLSSLIFGLFHMVFCLAQASAVTRPFTKRSSIGQMVRVASMSTIFTTPFFLLSMIKSFPDLYPSIDSFPVPFYAQIAFIIDDVLYRNKLGHDDTLFLTTFCVVTGIGLILTGVLLALATKFKLANLGAFLPYPVMAGFFSTIGLLIWTLAFSVDTGKHVGEVFVSHIRDYDELKSCSLHHFGSIIVAVLMKKVSAVNNSLVPLITFMTIPGAYLLLFLTNTTLEDARAMGWFWYDRDFRSTGESVGDYWDPPLPFGVIGGILEGRVHWAAVREALPMSIAMALIYFIRCSLHAPALKKNAENIQKNRDEQEKKISNSSNLAMVKQLSRHFSGASAADDTDDDNIDDDSLFEIESTRPSDEAAPMSMSDVYSVYGKILALTGLAGGSACLPSLGPSATITKLGATGSFPQIGSAVVLLSFYVTEFELLGFIPKVTFSSLLVLTAFSMIQDWFLKSYSKIKEKNEWTVVPLIVILSFTVGPLPSVFIGIAISTFIFVGAFYRSGVVKYIANGLTVHSCTERSPDDTHWLDLHGDLIQLVVLQNYIFFGNAYSCFNYIQSMFVEPTPDDLKKVDFPLPPVPKYLIVDFTMVTGIDASAVDVFADIISLCKDNRCKVIFCGLRKELFSILKCGGVKPSRKDKSSTLFFLPNMDTALRRAENALIMNVLKDEEKEMRRRARNIPVNSDDGFFDALKQIDSQHHMRVASKLIELAPFTEVVNLQRGESLDEQGSGLFFIEHGILKVERNAGNTTKTMRQRDGVLYATPRISESNSSIGHLRVRTATIGKESALLKHARTFREYSEQSHTIRLARIGPGFVVGSLEVALSSFNYRHGIHTAVTPCRLHLLSHEAVRDIEKENPSLAIELYKMMSQLSARRQASTIDQLGTLQAIMESLAPSKPVDRVTMAVVREAMKNF